MLGRIGLEELENVYSNWGFRELACMLAECTSICCLTFRETLRVGSRPLGFDHVSGGTA